MQQYLHSGFKHLKAKDEKMKTVLLPTLRVLMRSMLAKTPGMESCVWRLVNSQRMSESWAILRKLMRFPSTRSGRAVWRRMRSFRWTPLKSLSEEIFYSQEYLSRVNKQTIYIFVCLQENLFVECQVCNAVLCIQCNLERAKVIWNIELYVMQ